MLRKLWNWYMGLSDDAIAVVLVLVFFASFAGLVIVVSGR